MDSAPETWKTKRRRAEGSSATTTRPRSHEELVVGAPAFDQPSARGRPGADPARDDDVWASDSPRLGGGRVDCGADVVTVRSRRGKHQTVGDGIPGGGVKPTGVKVRFTVFGLRLGVGLAMSNRELGDIREASRTEPPTGHSLKPQQLLHFGFRTAKTTNVIYPGEELWRLSVRPDSVWPKQTECRPRHVAILHADQAFPTRPTCRYEDGTRIEEPLPTSPDSKID
ncbi:hypothetical protein MUK42_22069 [Musa troglodytarum]|uniref:Uncharacterized protein n=1 Tax=Musa troglodytarum TaxID=320322 RepID=A0A9E7GHP1_9LILI|nr:hypothetical protein MUK42_22069 [Musa troglodytarum]